MTDVNTLEPAAAPAATEPSPAPAPVEAVALPSDVEVAIAKIQSAGNVLEAAWKDAEARAAAAEIRALAFWSRNELWICIGVAAVASFLLGYFSPHAAPHR